MGYFDTLFPTLDKPDNQLPEAVPPTLDEQNREPHGFLGNVMDALSRPTYASAKFFDTVTADGLGAIGDAAGDAANELVHPKERLTFSDVIKHRNPVFAEDHPIATGLLGFIGDVALDPTTYIGIGLGGDALKVGEKVLSKAGKLELAAKLAEETGGAIEKGLDLKKAGAALQMKNLIAEQHAAAGALAQGLQTGADTGEAFKAFQDAGAKIRDFESLLSIEKPLTDAEKVAQFVKPELVRQSAEKKLLDMVAAGRSDLIDKGGLKFAGQTIVPGAAFSKLADISGITKVKDIIKNTKTFETVARAFNRNYKLAPEFIDLRKEAEAAVGHLEQDVITATKGLVGDLSDDSLKKITGMGADVESAVQDAVKTAQEAGMPLTDSAINDIAQNVRKSANLTPEEQAAYAKFMDAHGKIKDAEMEAGLLDHAVKNYNPMLNEAIKDGDGFNFYRKTKGIGKYLGREEAQRFATVEAARAAGYEPEMNAAVLYAMRKVSSERKLAKLKFEGDVKNMFNVKSMTELPERIKQDLQLMGKATFPPGMDDGVRGMGEAYDKMMRLFRTGATVIKPSFGVKQAISNTLAAFATSGLKAFKMFDPRSASEAAGLLAHNTGMFAEGSDVAKKLLAFTLSSPMNDRYTGKDILDLAKRFNVIKGTNVTGDAMRVSIRNELEKSTLQKALGPEHQGLAKMISGMGNYMNWSSHVEDWSRMSLFMNGLRMGHTPRSAAGLVDKALFDYSGGLSKFEKEFVRRIIPFYSYQRFAIPLVAQVIGTTPGRVINMEKTAKAFFSTWNKIEGGDNLTADERHVLPNYLLEQPNAFAKFDANTQAVFRTFNSFSPLDVLGIVQTDDNGNVDMQKSLLKAGLGQLAPQLKMPLEYLMDKSFFTDQAISRENNPKAGKIGDITPNGLLGNIVGMLAGRGGIPGLAAGKAAGTMLTTPEAIQSAVKRVLSWEEETDPRTGKRQVYINPYIAWGMTSIFPGFQQAIRMDNPERTPGEKVMDLFGGVGTAKVDLQQQAGYRQRAQQKQVRDLQDRVRKDMYYQHRNDAEEARYQLQELLKSIAADRQATNLANIRGGNV